MAVVELVCELIQDIFLSPPPLACKIKTIDYLWANCYVTMARRTILTALTVLIMSLCSVLKGRADTNPLIQFSREEYSKYHYALSVPFLLVNQEEIAQELKREKAEKKSLALQLTIILSISILIAFALAFCFVMYKKEQSAYKKLVENYRVLSDQVLRGRIGWSDPDIGALMTENESNPILERAQDYMAKTDNFLRNDLNIYKLATDLGVNRSRLSSAINASGSNFNNFVNQYRVSYAIRLLSQDSGKTIEDVATASGFNSGRSMRNAFKVLTGLYPSYFVKKT